MAVAAVTLGAASLPLKTVATVPLPGGSSRLDYASIDSKRQRLYVGHLGGGLVIVFDTKGRRVVKAIPAPGAHGVLSVPSLSRVYASATDTRELLTIDERTNKVIAAPRPVSIRTASPTTLRIAASTCPTSQAVRRSSSMPEVNESHR